MARAILVIGESGTGKSRSLKNLNPSETFLLNIIGKDLPFKGWKQNYIPYDKTTGKGNMITSFNPSTLVKALEAVGKMADVKTIVLDDFQYVMSYEFMSRATERGYDKFSEIAQNTWNIIKVAQGLPDNKTVVFLAHSEEIYADGFKKTKIKTIGRLLDEKITVEGMFTVVLQSAVVIENDQQKYVFVTQSDGTSTVKSPERMFENKYIPNDMQFVLEQIEKYNN
ncbi:AAA family ATPase [Immundisolibacter sp.]